jgi:hypothetical protein
MEYAWGGVLGNSVRTFAFVFVFAQVYACAGVDFPVHGWMCVSSDGGEGGVASQSCLGRLYFDPHLSSEEVAVFFH